MVKVDLKRILENTTFRVLKDIVYCNASTYRQRRSRVKIGLNALYYQVEKLIKMGLVEKQERGKLVSLVECPYCSKTIICNGAYPEGCFLKYEI